MDRTDATAFPAAIAELLRLIPLAPLGPGSPDQAAKGRLEALSAADFGASDRRMADCCRAGLWLAFGFLDRSHEICQEIETAEGSYWHAIMHRREPDPSNSKYWWRRVGDHPVFASLKDEAAQLGWKVWDAAAFVDECEHERGTGSERERLLREAQMAEWRSLFAWCWEKS